MRLYGSKASLGGGANNEGVVFKITTAGSETVLYSFAFGSSDGQKPYDNLTSAYGGLFGTTSYGGSSGRGTVFEVLPNYGFEIVIYNFAGSPDGAFPVGGLTNVGRTLYGTTTGGGASGVGTFFSLSL